MDVNTTTTGTRSESIPPPSDPVEAAAWHRDQAILATDPRTAGARCRPTWLTRRVLADHGRRR